MISGGKMQKQEIQICEYNSPFSKKKTKKNQQSYASIKNKELCVNYKCKVIPVPV